MPAREADSRLSLISLPQEPGILMADDKYVVQLKSFPDETARKRLYSFFVQQACLPAASVGYALDKLPVVVGNPLERSDAEQLKRALERAGAEAEIISPEEGVGYPRLGAANEPPSLGKTTAPQEEPPKEVSPPAASTKGPEETAAPPPEQPSFVRPAVTPAFIRPIPRRRRVSTFRRVRRAAFIVAILGAAGYLLYQRMQSGEPEPGGQRSQKSEPRGGLVSTLRSAVAAAVDRFSAGKGEKRARKAREAPYRPATTEKSWFRCQPGVDKPLLDSTGAPIARADVTALYGKAFTVRDEGLNVCSAAYAASQGLPEAKEPYGADLREWESAIVPPGRLAIDPLLGRLKFSQGKKAKLAKLGRVHVGWGEPNDVVVRGNYAFMAVAESSYNVVIYDVSTPSEPVLVGMVEHAKSRFGQGVMEWPSRIDVDSGRLYIPGRYKTLGIVDVSKPDRPRRLATVDLVGEGKGTVRSVVANGRYVYAFVWKVGLAVLDVSDPREPQTLSTVKVSAPFANLMPKPKIAGRYMFFPNNDSLIVFDLSTPARPREVTRVPVKCANLAISGKYLFAAALNEGLVVLDITTPTRPFVAGRAMLGGRAAEIAAVGRRAFVLVQPKGHERDQLVVVDVSNPEVPLVMASATADASSPGCRAFDDPQKPGERGRAIPVVNAEKINCFFTGIDARRDYVFVSDQRFGLRVFDASVPSAPRHVAGVKASGEVSAICAYGDRVYVGQNMKSGLSIIDVSNHAAPRWMSYFHTSQDIWSVATYRGRYVYFSGYSTRGNMLYALDVEDPRQPVVTWTKEGKYAMAAAVQDDVLIHGGDIYSLADPARPKFLARAAPAGVSAIGLGGSYVYFLRGKEFRVVDVRNPAKPLSVGTLSVSAPAGWFIHAMQVVGNLVYIPLGPKGVAVVDVSSPSSPRLAYEYPVTSEKLTIPLLSREVVARKFLGAQLGLGQERGSIISLNVVNSTLYAAEYWGKLLVVNIANRQAPKVTDQIPTYFAWKMLVHGGYLYWARLDGLRIFSIPRPPELPRGRPTCVTLR